MKKTIIGSVFMFLGVFIDISVIIVAYSYTPNITKWSGSSKLWYAIFGSKQYGNEVVQSLFLGPIFILGLLLGIIGLIMLLIEYFNK